MVEEINSVVCLHKLIIYVNLTSKTTNGHRFELILVIILVVYKVREK
jgi:hypothetical protein